eukprot:364562-Chlamydomonas_euryale.AAC.5
MPVGLGGNRHDPCVAKLPDKSSQISEQQPPLKQLYKAVQKGVYGLFMDMSIDCLWNAYRHCGHV